MEPGHHDADQPQARGITPRKVVSCNRMCGRFDLHSSVHELVRLLQAEMIAAAEPSYNIAPGQPVSVLRNSGAGGRELVPLRWGLVPGWSAGPDNRYRMINARAETISEKPAFRSPLRSRRCLIPADGFYEWQASPDGKQPCYISLADSEPFTMAGLWEHWRGADGKTIESCVIITTRANPLVARIHPRMPVIIDRHHHEQWLEPGITDADTLLPMLAPFDAGRMVAWPVSRRVNSPANDDRHCIEPVAQDP